MKISLLKLWVIWRRFRRGSAYSNQNQLQNVARVNALMRRANPFASWTERAHWMIDVAEWLRRNPKVSLLDEQARQRAIHQRIRFLLDWLDEHRDARRVVRTTVQKTLREAMGPELFCATGLPHEPAFFNELAERVIKMILPKPPMHQDLSALFTAMFPEPADANWLVSLDQKTLSRIWKFCADDGITHNCRQQIDEALIYLVTMIVSVGVSPDFRQRLEPRMPLQSTPFMALRRELENYLRLGAFDEAAVRSVRMLIAVCQAQTDRIYAHLDEHGVSIGLVYKVERMRAQLARMARLIDLKSGASGEDGAPQVQALLADLIDAHHHRATVRGLTRRSFSLLARKMVERNADHGERYIARDQNEYRTMVKAACIGGVLASFAVLGKLTLSGAGLAHFFEGLFSSLNYVVAFTAISALGGVFAAKQPAVIAPALASKMEALETMDGLRKLLREVAYLLRAQTAAMGGNLVAIVPTMIAIAVAVMMLSGTPAIAPQTASMELSQLSIFGGTPLFAMLTGVLLWIGGMAAGFADNWFALRRLREGLAHHRRLVYVLGASRAQRFANWLEQHIASIVGSLSLALLLGMAPAIAQFFGMPMDIRHAVFSAGTLTVAATSLGWEVFTLPEFWLALGSIIVIAVTNVSVAVACALLLALRARNVPKRVRRLVFRAIARRFLASPRTFLLPDKPGSAMAMFSTPGATLAPRTEKNPSKLQK